MMVRFIFSLSFALVLASCAGAARIPSDTALAPPEGDRTIYVVPFSTAMVPPEVEEALFDRLVDELNEKGEGRGFDFVILKQGTAGVDTAWLAQQNYITGEIFGYLEDSGCCSTVIRLRSRARLHLPGAAGRTAPDLEVPGESFFDHDYSTIEAERGRLIEKITVTLAQRLFSALSVR